MSIRTLAPAVMALAALLLVALAPTGAAAHGGAPHAHAHSIPHAGASDAIKGAATAAPAELRAQAPVPADHQAGTDCGDRGCCSAGHCSGCATAIAPASWTCLRLDSNVRLLSPDTVQPSSLAREGPPRPPKSFA
ncbi:MAG: hypothetical protein ACOY5F_06285 [Pseudomonadota bacterium]